MRNNISAIRLLIFLVFLTSAGASFAIAASARLDPAFGNSGKTTTAVSGSNDFVRRVRIQPDGKIVTFGSTQNLNTGPSFVVRHNADGTPDPSFGNIGRVVISSGVYGLSDFVVAANGDLVFTGLKDNGLGEPATAIYRLNNSGIGNVLADPGFDFCSGRRILAQPDGKIVVIAICNETGAAMGRIVAIRYKADGSFDSSFGSSGYADTNVPVFAHVEDWGAGTQMDFVGDPLLQPDGKIVMSAGGIDAVLIRLNPNGTLDTSFGGDGIVNTLYAFEGLPRTTGLALQSDGKIILNGVDAEFGLYRSFIFRFTSDGSPDLDFGTNGRVIIVESDPDSRGIASALGIERNGMIITGGMRDGMFALSRYRSNGLIDTTFGTGGLQTTAMDQNPGADTILSLAFQADGKLIAAGSVKNETSIYNVGLARYLVGQTAFDFDGDVRADVSVWRPTNGNWYLDRTTDGPRVMTWGVATDKLTPADYDGDGKTDLAVWRPANGTWYFFNSATSSFSTRSWGEAGDMPAAADFDADGRADLNVFRPSAGRWYRINSSTGHFVVLDYGQDGDRPVVGDYDGDGRADLAVFRPSNGRWYVQRTSAGYTVVAFGSAASLTVPADYDGDGRTEIAIINPTTTEWFYIDWDDNGLSTVLKLPLYQSGDVPVPADYDGDRAADFAIFRPSTGTWHFVDSQGAISQIAFGENGDVPVPTAVSY